MNLINLFLFVFFLCFTARLVTPQKYSRKKFYYDCLNTFVVSTPNEYSNREYFCLQQSAVAIKSFKKETEKYTNQFQEEQSSLTLANYEIQVKEFLCKGIKNGFKIRGLFNISIASTEVFVSNECPEYSGSFKKIDKCGECLFNYELVRQDSTRYSKEWIEICRNKGCEYLVKRPDVHNNEYLNIKIKLMKTVNEFCSLTVNKCKLYNNDSSSTTTITDFTAGDIQLLVDLNDDDTDNEDVYKKRIYTSSSRYYDTCRKMNCFKERETNSSYCRFHTNEPMVTENQAFYEEDLKLENFDVKLNHIKKILKYEFDININSEDFNIFVFSSFKKPTWWNERKIPYTFGSLDYSNYIDRLISSAYLHYNQTEKLTNGIYE